MKSSHTQTFKTEIHYYHINSLNSKYIFKTSCIIDTGVRFFTVCIKITAKHFSRLQVTISLSASGYKAQSAEVGWERLTASRVSWTPGAHYPPRPILYITEGNNETCQGLQETSFTLLLSTRPTPRLSSLNKSNQAEEKNIWCVCHWETSIRFCLWTCSEAGGLEIPFYLGVESLRSVNVKYHSNISTRKEQLHQGSDIQQIIQKLYIRFQLLTDKLVNFIHQYMEMMKCVKKLHKVSLTVNWTGRYSS